ncbi:MAG: DUF4352 domain-containing protein [Pseudomonadota bacterium]
MRRAVFLLLAPILLVTAALIFQSKTDAKSMSSFEYDKSGLGIAVSRVMVSESVVHNFGKPIYPEEQDTQYVWVYINMVNNGTNAVQVSPEEFTLLISGKVSVKYDPKATNSMQKGLKAFTLEPGRQNVGVLIFPMPVDSKYILHYRGANGEIAKRITITS